MGIIINNDYSDHFVKARTRMVDMQLKSRDITDSHVLKVMSLLPRHLFVDEALAEQAYSDAPLAIGEGQTISQPYIVAKMTQELHLTGQERVLEIGTGCGYQTAVLALLTRQVCTIERIKNLALKARRHLINLNLKNIVLRIGDGSKGWIEKAPYDAIIIAAGSPEIPKPLLNQLTDGGRMILPVGSEENQILVKIVRDGDRFKTYNLGDCRFVKLVGRHGWHRVKRAGDQFQKKSRVE
ncbi:protein-L-isoaspartate(D-aspartate) O-methyltransferase [bacterium]|nr:protein-L-isoaspartate(D-aspartate) O-methyltransferase [bacterium]